MGGCPPGNFSATETLDRVVVLGISEDALNRPEVGFSRAVRVAYILFKSILTATTLELISLMVSYVCDAKCEVRTICFLFKICHEFFVKGVWEIRWSLCRLLRVQNNNILLKDRQVVPPDKPGVLAWGCFV